MSLHAILSAPSLSQQLEKTQATQVSRSQAALKPTCSNMQRCTSRHDTCSERGQGTKDDAGERQTG